MDQEAVSLLSVALAVYGAEEWSTALDWVEVVFADFDFISDVLFSLEVYRVLSNCAPRHVRTIDSISQYLSSSCPAVQEYMSKNISNTSFRCAVSDDNCCFCGSCTSYSFVSACSTTYCGSTKCSATWSTKNHAMLELIGICSWAFIVIPVSFNLVLIWKDLGPGSGIPPLRGFGCLRC